MEDLLTDFKTTTEAEWKVRIEKDLKGITFEQLQQLDDNGILIDPFYTIEESKNAQAFFQHKDWDIVECIKVNDEKVANQVALTALRSGASGLYFQVEKTNCDWAVLFEDIQLNYISTYIEWISDIQAAPLEQFLQNSQVDKRTVCWGNDSLARYFASNDKSQFTSVEDLSSDAVLHIDGSLFYNAGVNSTNQLTYIIANVQERLHLLNENGTLASLQSIHIKVAAGTAFFEEIAKFRALRQLVALICAQYQLDVPVTILALTGSLYKAAADVYSNLLRDTIAGLAAVMGGADALCVLPFDEKSQKGNKNFSQRMSINQQLLMKEESYLNQIADVAQGSFYLEALTTQIAEKAWSHFKQIEANGGIVAYFESGELQKEVTKQAELLVEDFKSGKKIWIGLNKYPNATDMPKAMATGKQIEHAINPLEIAAFLNLPA